MGPGAVQDTVGLPKPSDRNSHQPKRWALPFRNHALMSASSGRALRGEPMPTKLQSDLELDVELVEKRSIRETVGNFVDRNTVAVMLMPAIVFLLIMILAPLTYALFLSFHEWGGGRTGPKFVGLDNFKAVFNDLRFRSALGVTVVFAALAVVLQMTLGIGTALILRREFVGQRLFRLVFILPMVLTPAAVALLWRLMYHPTLGLFNYLLGTVGFTDGVDWLISPRLALVSLVVVDVWQFTPLIALIVLAGLLALPSDVYEAAAVDGATQWQIFWRVTLPLLRPVIIIAMLFRTIDVMKVFDSIAIITGGGPGQATETLNFYIFRTTFEYQRMGYSSAMLVVYVMLVMAVLVFLLRVRRQSEHI